MSEIKLSLPSDASEELSVQDPLTLPLALSLGGCAKLSLFFFTNSVVARSVASNKDLASAFGLFKIGGDGGGEIEPKAPGESGEDKPDLGVELFSSEEKFVGDEED